MYDLFVTINYICIFCEIVNKLFSTYETWKFKCEFIGSFVHTHTYTYRNIFFTVMYVIISAWNNIVIKDKKDLSIFIDFIHIFVDSVILLDIFSNIATHF